MNLLTTFFNIKGTWLPTEASLAVRVFGIDFAVALTVPKRAEAFTILFQPFGGIVFIQVLPVWVLVGRVNSLYD